MKKSIWEYETRANKIVLNFKINRKFRILYTKLQRLLLSFFNYTIHLDMQRALNLILRYIFLENIHVDKISFSQATVISTNKMHMKVTTKWKDVTLQSNINSPYLLFKFSFEKNCQNVNKFSGVRPLTLNLSKNNFVNKRLKYYLIKNKQV